MLAVEIYKFKKKIKAKQQEFSPEIFSNFCIDAKWSDLR